MKKLVCVASPGSGVRHRFAFLHQVRNFAILHGYEVHYLWGVSRGVANCRWEELFAPLDCIRVTNISEAEVRRISRLNEVQNWIDWRGEGFDFVKEGQPFSAKLFCFDLRATTYLEEHTPPHQRPRKRLLAAPAMQIRLAVLELATRYHLFDRTGIRVRVTEDPHDSRKPHRHQGELDECLAPLLRLPMETPVFIVTDSEYIQWALVAHFREAVFLPKEFDLTENGSRYVHRSDRAAMFTFLEEAFCLCECQGVINIGGFLNDQAATIRLLPTDPRPGSRKRVAADDPVDTPA